MIVVENVKNKKEIDYNNFGNEMLDGRMTEESDGKIYKLRDAIMYSKVLGRPLTEEEINQFCIN